MRSAEVAGMRAFECDQCGSAVRFEAARCVLCEASLGYVPEQRVLRRLDEGPESAVLHDEASGATWRRCRNAAWGCNWMVSVDDQSTWCRSCRLTRSRPDVVRSDAIEAWMRAEADKRRVVHQLETLGLPAEGRTDVTPHGVAFDLVQLPGESALTGFHDGGITLDVVGTDERHRHAMRHQLDESFRTVDGLLRHEIGHHYWAQLVGQTDYLGGFRQLFGDERSDYRDAVAEHSATAHLTQPNDGYISHDAQAHPLEDWAETLTHYLHILDATGTARAHRLTIDDHEVPDSAATITEVVAAWIPIAEAVNEVSASLGSPPVYLFVLSDSVVAKLGFVHDRIVDHTARVRFYFATS